MKHNVELSSLEITIIRAALTMYAEAAKRKAEAAGTRRAAPAANTVQVAVAIAGLDKRLAELEQSSA